AHAEATRERASKRLDGPEAALARDLVHLGVAALERDPRALESHRLDIGGRREADLPLKDAGEVARAHERALGEDGHREVLVEMAGDPALKLAQRLAPWRLPGELGAELRLAAGPLEEEHQPPRHLERDVRAEVVLDERERQVDPRRHAGRGVDVPVAYEDRLGLHGYLGVAPAQLRAGRPVGRR